MTKKIIQVAGFSNSGKTTLMEKLVSASTSNGLKVGTIKHHGHGGELISLDEGKDSWKHRQAGAVVSAAVSKGTLQLNVLREHEWLPEQLLSLYEHFPIDVVFVEGFKASPFPKVVIIKNETDVRLLTNLESIFCVISWFPIPNEMKKQHISYFQLEEDHKYINFLLQTLKGKYNE
mgnify:CR=1 FL=1